MSTRYLMIESNNMPRQGVPGTLSTAFEVVDSVLHTFWKDEEGAMPVKVGDFLHLNCGGGLPTISLVQAPRRKADVLPWLLRFAKPIRVNSEAALEELLKKQRSSNNWWGYQEWSFAGDGYGFFRCNRPDCGGYCDLAAYIDSRVKVDKEFVMNVLANWASARISYPRSFAEQVLAERFGFTNDDLAELAEKHPDLWRH